MDQERAMKALLLNGSPHEHGCTDRGLQEIAKTLEKQGIKADIVWLGPDMVSDALIKHEQDKADELDKIIDEYDAFVFGTPVYYSAPTGRLCSFLNRIFHGKGKRFYGKIGAAIASCRRSGGVPAVDSIQHWMQLNCMIIPTGYYWNEIHGNTASEVEQDLEGLCDMRQLANMIAYLLKLKKLGDENGIQPEFEKPVRTNFVR